MTSLLNFTIYIYKLRVWILSLLICQLDHFFAALSCFTLLQWKYLIANLWWTWIFPILYYVYTLYHRFPSVLLALQIIKTKLRFLKWTIQCFLQLLSALLTKVHSFSSLSVLSMQPQNPHLARPCMHWCICKAPVIGGSRYSQAMFILTFLHL